MWYKFYLYIGVLLMIIPCCAGLTDAELLTILRSDKVVTSTDNITQVESDFKIDKTVQSHKHIRGWVDIIGFNGTTKIGNDSYINESNVIYKYKVWDSGLNWNNNFDSIKVTNERITTAGNITTVEIDVHLKWHRSTLRSRSVKTATGSRTVTWISKTYYNEYATFSQSKESPVMYPVPEQKTINVTVYNTTLAPKTIVALPPINYTLGYRVELDNETIEYFHSALAVERFDNGLSYGNSTTKFTQSIYQDSDLFSRVGNRIIINSTNVSGLNISVITPYEVLPINYSVTNYTEEPALEEIQLNQAFSMLMSAWVVVFLVRRYKP